MIKRFAQAVSLLVVSAGVAQAQTAPFESAAPAQEGPAAQAPARTTPEYAPPAQSREHVASDPNFQLGRDAHGNVVARDDSAGFGNPRQWVFSTDAGLQISRTTISGVDGSQATIIIQPALDYFVIKNLSVGGAVGVNYTKAGSEKATVFNIGPRVGYNFELTRMLSVWPRLGLSYSHSNQNNGDNKANSVALNLFAPVMLHPAPHFFAGLGPFVDADLSGDNRATTWGIKLTIGGWIQQKARG